ncbi:ATP-binding protein [Streptomyces sp. NPDC051555]|uniref:ATP-binding protein n=1 Tax=Streptomyces sp. NPDC051555 TaxID=3365657 RepID=UPI0037981B37
MSDQAVGSAVPSRRRRREGTGDDLRLPPAVTAAALTALAVGGGWAADGSGVLPTTGSVLLASAAVGSVLWWTTIRSMGARRSAVRLQRLRTDRDEALGALDELVTAVAEGRDHIRWALDQAQRGLARADFEAVVEAPRTGDVLADSVATVRLGFTESWQAILTVAARRHGTLESQAELAEVFASLAPRLHGLVTRGISLISEVERTVEDPDLLGELFRIDHLLTQMRREVESLLVLGGNVPSRNTPPVLVVGAIRRAVGEIPDYARVRLAPDPVTDAVPGYVSPNLTHLLAALMENATRYSVHQVEVHTHRTETGIAIEILDRGAGMSPEKRETLNRLLADPESADPRARLREGTLGLLVAALLARRHKISITLRPNVLGGTQAIVLLPRELLVAPAMEQPYTQQPSAQAPVRTGAGPARASQAAPDQAGVLPRRIRPTAEVSEHTLAVADDSRPALPRRAPSQSGHVAPAPRQAPAGHPTGGLMASFQSRTPRAQEPAPGSPPGRPTPALSDTTTQE